MSAITTQCIAIRSMTHGQYYYRQAYRYEVREGRWEKQELLFETTKDAQRKFNSLLQEYCGKLGLEVMDVRHGDRVEGK